MNKIEIFTVMICDENGMFRALSTIGYYTEEDVFKFLREKRNAENTEDSPYIFTDEQGNIYKIKVITIRGVI
jgi:hypothetical protein